MERTGVPFMAVSAQWPRLDGLRVLVDDGRNDVLPAAAREALVAWVRAGGALIAFPTTGRCDAAGGPETLASALGLDFAALAAAGDPASVGQGQVIALPSVPAADGSPTGPALLAALASRGIRPTVAVNPPVNQAVFERDGHRFVVLYNKSVELVGSFFSEDRIPAVEAALPDLRLALELPAGTTRARELLTGTDLPVTAGRTTVDLPATCWRVVELSP
jgi:hypothetical protein